jgi:hypothetical protein
MANDKFIPIKSSAIYKAAELINSAGPRSKEVLLTEIDFGPKKERHGKFEHAFSIGWLCETPAGTIDVTEKSRKFFAYAEPNGEPIGEIKPAPTLPQYRGDWRGSQGISKKNIPNRRGLRPASDLAPAWSVRETVSIKTISGGDA